MSAKTNSSIKTASIAALVALGMGAFIPVANACDGDACASFSINVSAKEIVNKDKSKDIHIVGCLKAKQKIAGGFLTCNINGHIDATLRKGGEYSYKGLEDVIKAKGSIDGDVQVDITKAVYLLK